MQFHNVIIKVSGNPLIGEYVDMILNEGNITIFILKYHNAKIQEHRIILQVMC